MSNYGGDTFTGGRSNNLTDENGHLIPHMHNLQLLTTRYSEIELKTVPFEDLPVCLFKSQRKLP